VSLHITQSSMTEIAIIMKLQSYKSIDILQPYTVSTTSPYSLGLSQQAPKLDRANYAPTLNSPKILLDEESLVPVDRYYHTRRGSYSVMSYEAVSTASSAAVTMVGSVINLIPRGSLHIAEGKVDVDFR
jgi:hypothetical protein